MIIKNKRLSAVILLLFSLMLLSSCEKNKDKGSNPGSSADAQRALEDQNYWAESEQRRLNVENYNDGGPCGSNVQDHFYRLQVECSQTIIVDCAEVARQFLLRYPGINCHALNKGNQFNDTAVRNRRAEYVEPGLVPSPVVPNSGATIHIHAGRIQEIINASITLGY